MRRETGCDGGDAREGPVFPARSAGLPWAVLGTGGGAVQPRPGPVPVVLPGPAASPCRSRAGARRGSRARWPGRLALGVARRAARAVCGRRGCAAAASRSSSPGGVPGDLARLCRRHQPPPGDAGQVPRCPGLAPSRIRRWCAHRVPVDARDPGPGRMRYLARHLTIRPASPLPGRREWAWCLRRLDLRLHRHGRDLAGLPRASPELSAWPGGTGAGGLPVPLRQPLVPTGLPGPVRIFSNHAVLAGAPLRNRTIDLLLTIGFQSAS